MSESNDKPTKSEFELMMYKIYALLGKLKDEQLDGDVEEAQVYIRNRFLSDPDFDASTLMGRLVSNTFYRIEGEGKLIYLKDEESNKERR